MKDSVMVASHSCRGISLLCLLAVLISTNGATEDFRFQKKSFAIYGSHSQYRAARAAPRGEKTRFSRQAGEGAMSYSPDETQALLNSHLEYRRNVDPPAADMNFITWNTELAALAKGWAERCEFEHGFPSTPELYGGLIAQNMWMGSTSYALTDAVKAWYDENEDYDYTADACSAECGHYRVMVYSRLEAIGCGSAICDSGSKMLTVCNYGPSIGDRGYPYKAGPPCGLCASGTGWCDNKLCRADCGEGGATNCECNLQCQNCGELNSDLCKCTCKAGWRGTDCSEPCADYESYCSSGAYTPKACVPDPGAQKDCPATCELCSGLNDMTAPEDKCCDGKGCDAGSVLDVTSCKCVDYMYIGGDGGGDGGGPGGGVAHVAVSWTCIAAFPVLTSVHLMLIG